MTDIRDHTCDICSTRAVVRCSSHLRIWYACRAHTHRAFTQRNHQLISEQQQRDYERDQPEDAL